MKDHDEDVQTLSRNSWDVPKIRKCLTCGEKFESAWSGERICKKCKSTSAWKSGVMDGGVSGGRG